MLNLAEKTGLVGGQRIDHHGNLPASTVGFEQTQIAVETVESE